MNLSLVAAGLAQQADGVPLGKYALAGALGAVTALLAGYLLTRWLGRTRLDAARNEAQRILADTKSEADVLRKSAQVDAKAEFLKGQEQLRKESTELRVELKQVEKRLTKREDNLEAKLDTLATKDDVLAGPYPDPHRSGLDP